MLLSLSILCVRVCVCVCVRVVVVALGAGCGTVQLVPFTHSKYVFFLLCDTTLHSVSSPSAVLLTSAL